MVWWRRAPTCRGTTADGSPCTQRVARPGDHCTACLEVLASSPDRHTRRKLAGQSELAPHLIDALAADEDRRIRLTIARRADCPLVTLQRLEHDDDAAIRAVAGSGLSAALAPRALAASEAGGLFTEAELEALADAPLDRLRLLDEADPAADPAADHEADHEADHAVDPRLEHVATSEVLQRLDAISQRLTALEALVASEVPPAARRTRRVAPSGTDDAQPRLPGLSEPAATRRPEPGIPRRRRLHSRRP